MTAIYSVAVDFEPGQATWQLGYRINRIELALRAQIGELRGELNVLRDELACARRELLEQATRTQALVESLHQLLDRRV